jgi:hypothetical protein
VVSVLAIGTKVRGFKPDGGRWIFNGDKNLLYDFLQREVKPSVECREILRYLKDPYITETDTCRLNSRKSLSKFLPVSILGVSAGYCQRALNQK